MTVFLARRATCGNVQEGVGCRTSAFLSSQKELDSQLSAPQRQPSWGSIEDYAFPSQFDHSRHMSTRRYARFADDWMTAIGLRSEEFGAHSLRRTKASMSYRATGNIRAIQILLGHSKIENTVRYLGVDVEDALLLAERTKI